MGKNTNKVEEYLVKRIEELETENENLKTTIKDKDKVLVFQESELERFNKIKSLFRLDGSDGCYAITLLNLDGNFEHIIATEHNKDFTQYITLLDLGLTYTYMKYKESFRKDTKE